MFVSSIVVKQQNGATNIRRKSGYIRIYARVIITLETKFHEVLLIQEPQVPKPQRGEIQ
jgi:hypothetical protein